MSQTILITGASSGIGKETAKLFQSRGWNVIATMRTPENEEELTKLDNVLVTRLDVTDADSIQSAVAAGLEKFGKIDALLNNAGYGAYGPLEAFPMDRIRRQFDTNVIGLLETTKAVLPHLRQQGSGTIVNISSIVGATGNPGQGNYAAAKAGMVGMSKSLAYEVATRGITVNAVAPGFIETAMTDKLNDEQKAAIMGQIPAGRMGTPEEIAAAVLYLSSPEAAYVTGTTLHVNGGMAML